MLVLYVVFNGLDFCYGLGVRCLEWGRVVGILFLFGGILYFCFLCFSIFFFCFLFKVLYLVCGVLVFGCYYVCVYVSLLILECVCVCVCICMYVFVFCFFWVRLLFLVFSFIFCNFSVLVWERDEMFLDFLLYLGCRVRVSLIIRLVCFLIVFV